MTVSDWVNKATMKIINDTLRLSATDLVSFLNCHHLTQLELMVAQHQKQRPQNHDPLLDILRERGQRHESSYLERLIDIGLNVVVIPESDINEQATQATREAIVLGADVIAQAALLSSPWAGRADFLRKVNQPSKLGDWRYEVYDTKLSRETKAGTLLQLCLYADLLTQLQGEPPEYIHVVVPWSDFEPHSYRYTDFAAYFRYIKAQAEVAITAQPDETSYPDPVPHCNVCQWNADCDKQRRDDDHLSFVAGISVQQIKECNEQGIATLTELASQALPLTWRPARGAAASYQRLVEQAAIQLKSRQSGALQIELLPVVAEFGLAALPEPSLGDIFFDIESDPYVGEHGLEYLFGYGYFDEHGIWTCIQEWGFSPNQEKDIFERFIDFVMAARERFPNMHIYHFAPYEPGALKRLMGRYGTREDEVDRLLRGKALVDLHSVVRHALRAGVESYSLKKLEPFYDFKREIPLRHANSALTKLSALLELSGVSEIDESIRGVIGSYNEDDCLSTARLRDWLEQLRVQVQLDQGEIPRPAPPEEAPSAQLSERAQQVKALVRQLTEDVPADLAQCDADQWGRWVLAQCLDWHRREEKSLWWEFFRLSALAADELEDERGALAGLQFEQRMELTTRGIPTDRYRFDSQDVDIRPGDELRCVGGEKLGTVVAISLEDGLVDIKKNRTTADFHPEGVFSHRHIATKTQADALFRLASYVAEHGLQAGSQYLSAKALLLCEDLPDSVSEKVAEDTLQRALNLSQSMPCGVIPVQGPPGTGKSFTGAHMICELIKAGKRVGVTANSHKVIRNLIDKVIEVAASKNLPVVCGHKAEQNNQEEDSDQLLIYAKNDQMLEALAQQEIAVGGGTHFLWSSEPFFDSVDVLVVDEAAQMSIANVLAVSQAAPLLVLLGDPNQLEQPMQGTHPEGAGVSALEHILKGRKTISARQGIFLGTTWRMHPDISVFISEMFYEGKLKSVDTASQQRVTASEIAGSGLRFHPVIHYGNSNASKEEASYIKSLLERVLSQSPQWIDRNGQAHALQLQDVLVITPYNAQVSEIRALIPEVNVGTVDKYQGQEAPIVIYSMASSSHEDAPRGMEFLYSANRLNVAISRAMCVAIVVASPAVFEVECKTPRQMQLANAHCRYLELCP